MENDRESIRLLLLRDNLAECADKPYLCRWISDKIKEATKDKDEQITNLCQQVSDLLKEHTKLREQAKEKDSELELTQEAYWQNERMIIELQSELKEARELIERVGPEFEKLFSMIFENEVVPKSSVDLKREIEELLKPK